MKKIVHTGHIVGEETGIKQFYKDLNEMINDFQTNKNLDVELQYSSSVSQEHKYFSVLLVGREKYEENQK